MTTAYASQDATGTTPDAAFEKRTALLTRSGGRLYALPLAHVVEVTRELPVDRVEGAPSFVRGVTVIRGVPTPVVDLGIVTGTGTGAGGRMVVVRTGEWRTALAVDEVVAVRTFAGGLLDDLPPLLGDAGASVVAAIGVVHDGLLLMLHAGRLVPDEVWQALGAHGEHA